jgi:hypothetical protein
MGVAIALRVKMIGAEPELQRGSLQQRGRQTLHELDS